jgi:hypothetical protein
MNLLAGEDVPPDPVDDWLQQPGRLTLAGLTLLSPRGDGKRTARRRSTFA